MCEPTYFDIEYVINAWMDVDNRVDRPRAARQWQALGDIYRRLGMEIETIEPVKGLPDMVFTANGALVIGGKVALPNFRHGQRRPETNHFADWFLDHGYRSFHKPRGFFEGEGDALVLGDRVLGGWGFRSDRAAHAELAEFFGCEVVSLHLINDHFYHIDTCLSILSDAAIAFYPAAFDENSQKVLRGLAKTVIEVGKSDADAFGLNAMSDGRHVVCSDRAKGFHRQLKIAGFEPVPVDISEFQKSGGGVKCLTLALRTP
jgi:N-dimethylarginine dimethylaminohydrolase